MAIDLRKPTKPTPAPVATTKQSITPVIIGLGIVLAVIALTFLTSFNCTNYAK